MQQLALKPNSRYVALVKLSDSGTITVDLKKSNKDANSSL